MLDANAASQVLSKDFYLKEIYKNISDIVLGIGSERDVDIKLKLISNRNAAKLKYNHPLGW